VTRAGDQDWLLKFLNEFAAMSEEERDAAIDALPAEGRDALVALAEARAETADADLIGSLDAGHAGLDRLYEVTNPDDLFAVISLAVRDRPSIVVEALFAAVVLHRSWDEGEPAAINELRERWHWHVHELITAEQERERSEAAAQQGEGGQRAAAEREPPAVAEQPREGA
jgi:hypothetical protein